MVFSGGDGGEPESINGGDSGGLNSFSLGDSVGDALDGFKGVGNSDGGLAIDRGK